MSKSIFETHKDKIYPWVKVFLNNDDSDADASMDMELEDGDSLVTTDWLGDLGLLYVADVGDSFQVLLERDLPADVTSEELHQIACDNLNRDIDFELRETNFGGYGLIAGGDHEAGSICLPEMWEWLADHLDDNLIVAIPAKDLVVMAPESDTDRVDNLKIFAHEVFKAGERLLTKNIFRFDRETKEWTIISAVA